MREVPFEEIEPEEAVRLMEETEMHVVDVRQPYEWAGGHIEGATLLPIEGLYSFARLLAGQELDKDQPLLFVCAVGQRSAAAAEVAAIAGYRHVYNLVGGMGNWSYSGLPVVRGN